MLCFKVFPDGRITVFTYALMLVSGSAADKICTAQINDSTCSATSSPVDDHSSCMYGETKQTTVIATPTITDVQGKGEVTTTFDEH